MHELGIAQEMLKVGFEYATKNNAARITAFNIEMSAAADESEDSLRFHFDNIARGTIAEGARVEITRVPARASCFDCGNEFPWQPPDAVCPRCASPRVRVLVHEEFKLASIDVE